MAKGKRVVVAYLWPTRQCFLVSEGSLAPDPCSFIASSRPCKRQCSKAMETLSLVLSRWIQPLCGCLAFPPSPLPAGRGSSPLGRWPGLSPVSVQKWGDGDRAQWGGIKRPRQHRSLMAPFWKCSLPSACQEGDQWQWCSDIRGCVFTVRWGRAPHPPVMAPQPCQLPPSPDQQHRYVSSVLASQLNWLFSVVPAPCFRKRVNPEKQRPSAVPAMAMASYQNHHI